MKSVYDLNPDELDELRATHYWLCLDEGIIDIDGISDETLFEHYSGISFVDDDFFCNEKEGI